MILADHNSSMDKELDREEDRAEVPEIRRAREEEKEAYERLGIVDSSAICHPEPECKEEKGLTGREGGSNGPITGVYRSAGK